MHSVFCLASDQSNNDSLDNSNVLIGDKLSRLPGVFAFSDTWFTRNFIDRQSLYNSISIAYNNLELNSVIDGSFRGDLGVFQSNNILNNNDEPDIFSTSHSSSGNIFINNRIADSASFVSILEGGNVFGSTNINYTGINRYLKWQAGLNYITSGGYDVSLSKPDSIGLARSNTVFDKLTANGRLQISDTKSSLDAEFIFSKGNQNMPYNLYPENSIYLKESDFTMNLFNLMFKSYVNTGIVLNGNLFYYRTKSVLEKYDSPEMLSKELLSSFVKTFEESRFGWNSSLQFDTENIPPGEIALNYSRESLKYQKNAGLAINRFEIERITLGLKFAENFEIWNYTIGSSYRLLNPLTTEQNQIIESFSNVTFFFSVGLRIFDNAQLKAKSSRDAMLPQLYTIYPEINHTEYYADVAQTSISNSYEVAFEHKVSNKLKYEVKYFKAQLENVQMPMAMIDYPVYNFANSYDNDGFELSLEADLYLAKISAYVQYFTNKSNSFDSYGREILVPDFRANLSISDEYNFGLSWQFYFNLVSGRKSSSVQNLILNDFFVANVILSQKVYKSNEIYLRIHNFTDTYYEYFYGMPMPGIYFVAGIKLSL